MTLTVHLDPFTINCRKVLAGLEMIGTDYKVNEMNYLNGDQKAPDFVKNINPMATIPAATDGDLTIIESNAILAYVAERDETAYPKDPKKRAPINSWLLWEASVWFASCYTYVVENVVKPAVMKMEPDQSVLDKEKPNFEKLAGILDKQLSNSKYLCGDKPTIADIAVAAPFHLWKGSKLPVDQFPNLMRWYTQDIKSLPAWQKTQDAVDKTLGPGMDS